MPAYVVGYVSSEGDLSRTIACNTFEEVERAMKILMQENKDNIETAENFWEDATSLVADHGTYFCGELEDIKDA